MIYDVSVPIENGMPVWPSDPGVSLTPSAVSLARQPTQIRVTTIEMGSHTGTHIDAPYHFVDGGEKLHEIPLELLVGKVAVFHIAGVRSIKRRHLEQLDWLGVERVLFKTDNSDHWKDERSTRISSISNRTPEHSWWSEACALSESTISPSTGLIPSTIRRIWCCCRKNVVILEGLNLSEVAPGRIIWWRCR